MKEIRDDVSMVFEGPKYMLHVCKIFFTLLKSEQLDPLEDLRPPTNLNYSQQDPYGSRGVTIHTLI